MTNLASYSVPFENAIIQRELQAAVWRDYSPEKKEDLFRELRSPRNLEAWVHVHPRTEILELAFKRQLSDCAFVAGKWVKLVDFQQFHQIAKSISQE